MPKQPNRQMPDLLDTMDWSLPVREVAKTLGCSTQRVYQLIKQYGITRPPPHPERVLKSLQTTRYTLAELSHRVNRSEQYTRRLLSKLDLEYRKPSVTAPGWPHRAEFIAWLQKTYAYPRNVASDMASRCARIDAALPSSLSRACSSEKGLERVIETLETNPTLVLRDHSKKSALGAYKLAIRRLHLYLHHAKAKTEAPSSRRGVPG